MSIEAERAVPDTGVTDEARDMTGSEAVPGRAATRGVPIEMTAISKSFRLHRGRDVEAIQGFDLSVSPGEFVAVIGPSGCGKSTVLRMIASLEQPTRGTITVDDRRPDEMVAHHRLGVAFQDHALLPWSTVWHNIALPYRIARRPVNKERVAALIDLVGLTGFEQARPKQLSGGMRQRASIARALVLEPDALLLDEPFGALDAVTRRRLNLELQRTWMADPVTTVLVTHDVDEALLLADRVVVMSARPGRVQMIREVPFPRPRTADFVRTEMFHKLVDELTAQLDNLSREFGAADGSA